MNFVDLVPDVKYAIFSEATKPCYNTYFVNDTENRISQITQISLVCKEWYTLARANCIWESVLDHLLNVCKLHDHLNHLTNFNSLTHSRDKIKRLMKNLIEIKNFYIKAGILFPYYQKLGLEFESVKLSGPNDYRRICSPFHLTIENTNDPDLNEQLLNGLIENKEFALAKKILSLKPNLPERVNIADLYEIISRNNN